MRIYSHINTSKLNKFLLLYCISVSFLFMFTMLFYCKFNFSAPLDDAFIYFQYARNTAFGHFFEYVKGEGYSSGATSFIYIFFLMPFIYIFKGQFIIIATYIIGGACLFISGYFLYKFTYELTQNEKLSFWGVILLISNGNILWGFFSGMEICLIFVAIIISLYYIFVSKEIYKKILALCFLSLIRPESYILVLVFFITRIFNRIYNKKEKLLPFIIPVITGFIYFLLNKIFTGDFMPNTMRAKSNFSLYYFDYVEMIKHGLVFYLQFLKDIFNGEKEHYFLHYSFFFFLLGILPGIAKEIKNKKIEIFTTSFFWFFIGVMSTMFSSFASVHNYRYTMPFTIIFVPFLINGLKFILESLKIIKNNLIVSAVLSVFIFFNIFTFFANLINFGRDCNAIYSQSIQAGNWLSKNLKDKKVAINDIGAIQYFFNGKIFDLVGLATNHQAINFRNGLPGVFEALEQVKPEYFMIHIGWFNYEPYTVFKKPKLVEFSIEREPPYYVIGSPEICFKTDISLFNSGDFMLEDFTENGNFILKDKIDVCDIISEKEHSYKIWVKWHGEYPGTELYEEDYKNTGKKIIDAGRITSGGEQFKIRNLKPSIDTKIIIRTYKNPKNILNIYLNNKKIGEWILKESQGFSENEFLIKGDLIKNKEEIIKLEVVSKNRYNSFYYFILQKKDQGEK